MLGGFNINVKNYVVL